MNMTSDQMWAAIQGLDPAAELRFEPPVWCVRLPAVVYEALNDMCTVASPQAHSKDQAIERMWARLTSLQESSSLHRDLGPAQTASGHRYEEVRWNGSEWTRIGIDG
jgi:hypothetical protein